MNFTRDSSRRAIVGPRTPITPTVIIDSQSPVENQLQSLQPQQVRRFSDFPQPPNNDNQQQSRSRSGPPSSNKDNKRSQGNNQPNKPFRKKANNTKEGYNYSCK